VFWVVFYQFCRAPHKMGGIALLYRTNATPANHWVLGITLLITIIISELD
jgi:hypothetical protein